MTDATLADRVAIRELYGRYALAAAQRDADAWLGCWTEDAVWKTPQMEVAGQAVLRQAFAGVWTQFKSVAAFFEVGPIALSGDEGRATASVLEVIELAKGGGMRMAGFYQDTFRRENGEWRFARREYSLLSQGA